MSVDVIDLAMTDDKLACWLSQQKPSDSRITLIRARHLCAFTVGCDTDARLHFADVNTDSMTLLEQIAKKRQLYSIEVDYDALSQATVSNGEWISQAITISLQDLRKWNTYRQNLFKQGRGKPLKARDEQRVWHESGGRCMYRGCGDDLGLTSLSEKSAAAGYLAHIVASDEDGPRGDREWSHKLSDDPNNVMLMCDEHHRLIDRIDVAGHPRETLEIMRAEHVGKVRLTLDSLRFPHARGTALLGDVGNIKTPLQLRDMREAMLGRGLSPAPEIDQLVRHFSRDDRTSPDFWRWVLREYENDFRELIRRLGATQPLGDQVEVLSVFPFHFVPVLILCGRIFGEARRIEVFQYSRGKSWQWSPASNKQVDGFFYLDKVNCSSGNQYTEAVLSLELTAEIDMNAVPESLKNEIANGNVPWIRVRAKLPDPACIAHPDDLAQFTEIARKAVYEVQDVLRIKQIHLFGISPASTLFRFGQVLQAGHHPSYTVYDRPDRTRPFNPAICITGQHVHEAPLDGCVPVQFLQLR